MNAPYHPTARNIANVLVELKQAQRDWEDAMSDAEFGLKDADDRMLEAEKRFEELRAEFAATFERNNGVTWRAVETAVAEALL
jgi:hypothetical protein